MFYTFINGRRKTVVPCNEVSVDICHYGSIRVQSIHSNHGWINVKQLSVIARAEDCLEWLGLDEDKQDD